MQMNKENFIADLKDLNKCFKKINYEFWIIGGVLLGHVRDGDFLPWDDEMDISLRLPCPELQEDQQEEYLKNWLKPFEEEGFSVEISKPKLYFGWIIQLNKRTRTDLMILEEYKGDLCYSYDQHYFYYPKEMFEKMDKIRIGDEDFNIPTPVEKFLYMKYGDEWKIPKAKIIEKKKTLSKSEFISLYNKKLAWRSEDQCMWAGRNLRQGMIDDYSNVKDNDYKLFRQVIFASETCKIIKPFPNKEMCVALSGGLDSSAIAAMYAKQRPDIRSYSIGFEDCNENDKAEIVARYLGIKHKSMIISKKEYEETCRKLIRLKWGPILIPNEALIYLIAEEFKKDIGDKEGIVLLGEGADELFGGYTNILETVPVMDGDLLQNYINRIVYNKDLWENLSEEENKIYYQIFYQEYKKYKGSSHNKIQDLIYTFHLPTLIQRSEIVRFVKGIDFFIPFLEAQWLYIYKILPQELKVNKTFLRIIFSRILPKETLDAKKIGFALPIDLNKWQDWNLEVFRSSKEINFKENGKSEIKFWKY